MNDSRLQVAVDHLDAAGKLLSEIRREGRSAGCTPRDLEMLERAETLADTAVMNIETVAMQSGCQS